MSIIDIFKNEYVINVEAASITFAQWKKQQPGEYNKWVAFRDAIIAAQSPDEFPVPPAMSTRKGKELVAAGKVAIESAGIFLCFQQI